MKLELRAFDVRACLPCFLAGAGREMVNTRGASLAKVEDRSMLGLSGVELRNIRARHARSRVGLRRGCKMSPSWRVEVKKPWSRLGNTNAPHFCTFREILTELPACLMMR